jgi:hypothetical protein
MQSFKRIQLWVFLMALCFGGVGCESMMQSAFDEADFNQRTHDYEKRGPGPRQRERHV